MQTKIFITCKGLNLAKTTVVHDKGYKSLGVSNLEKQTTRQLCGNRLTGLE